MNLRIFIGLVCAVAAVIVPSMAGAAPTPPASKALVAGSATVASCGALTGVVTDFSISAGSVTAVVLSIPSTCNGASVNVNVTNSGTSLASGGPVTVAAGAATVAISPAVPTGNVTHVRLVLTGP